MTLTNKLTGKTAEAVIERMNKEDFKYIEKRRTRFNKFNWIEYKEKEVYKLLLRNEDKILGLMCIIEHTDKAIDAIEIDLLEVSAENIGQDKEWENIGGCMIAFACREAFKRGHDGCVFLTPKTQLIQHYQVIYGFFHMPVRTSERPEGLMVLTNNAARNLIKKYLD